VAGWRVRPTWCARRYGWASAAYLVALKRTVNELIANGYEAGSLGPGESPPVVVGEADFIEAAADVRGTICLPTACLVACRPTCAPSFCRGVWPGSRRRVFLCAKIWQVRPSVSPQTLREYEAMRQRYSNTNSGVLSGSDGSAPAAEPTPPPRPVPAHRPTHGKQPAPNTRRRMAAGEPASGVVGIDALFGVCKVLHPLLPTSR
jgi:hypothetical protein